MCVLYNCTVVTVHRHPIVHMFGSNISFHYFSIPQSSCWLSHIKYNFCPSVLFQGSLFTSRCTILVICCLHKALEDFLTVELPRIVGFSQFFKLWEFFLWDFVLCDFVRGDFLLCDFLVGIMSVRLCPDTADPNLHVCSSHFMCKLAIHCRHKRLRCDIIEAVNTGR